MKISILTPAHNEASHIGDMIQSVLEQSHTDWELLIVDDRSEDDTIKVVANFRDPRVRLVDNTDVVGKNAGFNRAFSHASGDVIVYFGADDLMPPRALELRARAFAGVDCKSELVAAFSKVRMFSEDRRFDGVIVPKGQRGSRSGGTTAMTYALAEIVFPLPASLPNEDLWTSSIVRFRAAKTVENPVVAVNYRIHADNSFKREQSFSSMNEAVARRGAVYKLLLESSTMSWTQHERDWLSNQAVLEELRYEGRVLALLRHRDADLTERLRLLSQASPLLYWIRQSAYRAFSGW